MGIKQRATLYWLILGSVAVFCCILAIVQYRWTGELARAERDRLRSGLQAALHILSRGFNADLAAICTALQPTSDEVAAQGREQAYIERYREWLKSGGDGEMFRRIAIATPENSGLGLQVLDSQGLHLSASAWPEGWDELRSALLQRVTRGPPPPALTHPFVFEAPRFGRGAGPRIAEQEWLILELNPEYLSETLIPELLRRHLTPVGALDLEVEVFARQQPSIVIYRSHPGSHERIGADAEASVALFEVRPAPERAGGQRPSQPMMAGDPGRGRWQLLVWSHGGSLNALVERGRRRNLATSGGILVLLLASVFLLFRSSRRAQQLAELQMNFVAGVSHELRTPLTVIRTAAFNLREKVFTNPDKVQQYGMLIEEESEKLNLLVEQVLRFASARRGRIIGERSPVRVESVIEEGIQASRHILDEAGCVIETSVQPQLPLVFADGPALRQVVQNLIENAAKYGMNGSKWIGITADNPDFERPPSIRIRVCDRGHGIPPEEQSHIFDAFFRGRRALQNQVHGTGLGLNLVKQIVEAHGGTVGVSSEVERGTEFIVRIPALQSENAG